MNCVHREIKDKVVSDVENTVRHINRAASLDVHINLTMALEPNNMWFIWFVLHRARVMALAELVDERSLDDAIADRAAEARAGGIR